jgi:hypothetical protein
VYRWLSGGITVVSDPVPQLSARILLFEICHQRWPFFLEERKSQKASIKRGKAHFSRNADSRKGKS